MAEALSFSRDLYAAEAIDAVVEVWREHAELTVEPHADVILVHLEPRRGDAEAVRDTFCNHVLFETIVRARGESEAG